MEKVIIIGSGPAGYTAAIYAARANLAPVLFQGPEPGGQLMTTSDVENYPGFPKGLLGPEMMELFREQAERFGTKVVEAAIKAVDFSTSPFKVTADDNNTYESQTVIISTGACAKRLGLENEKKLYGKGVSACATCDGFFFKDKTVVVVGGGDTAMEESLFLTRFAAKEYVVHRRDSLRASKIMQDRALQHPKIEFLWDSVVLDVLGAEVNRVTGVVIKNLKTGERREIACEGVFAAIGHEPNTKVFEGKIELDKKRYVVTRPGSTATSVEGVFAGGDCVDHKYRQAVTAAGMGCMAAMDAEKWLEAQEA
ncbi:MAG: thioredoxin-disulfide reductase [Armatimonadetes bacterium]|nr:thioredoxin-disulfide reductase [Armatimonadota bacterium]